MILQGRRFWERTQSPRRDWPHHRPKEPRPQDVTVCIATMMAWNYGTRDTPSFGSACIVMSDRKITFGDTEFEPLTAKIASITRRTVITIAGDYSLHTPKQCVGPTNKQKTAMG